jgi:serine/threonine protein kinase
MAELYNFKPIFNGGTEKEVFFKIASILGSPNVNNWPEGVQLAKKCDIKLPICSGMQLNNLIPNASKEAISLLSEMLVWDPNKRSTACKLLQHPFFTNNEIPTSLTDGFGGHTNNNNPINSLDGLTNDQKNDKTFKSFSNANRQNNNNNNNSKIYNNSNTNKSKIINSKNDDDISKMLEDTVGFNKCN